MKNQQVKNNLKKYLETNENENGNTTHQNFWDTAKQFYKKSLYQ